MADENTRGRTVKVAHQGQDAVRGPTIKGGNLNQNTLFTGTLFDDESIQNFLQGIAEGRFAEPEDPGEFVVAPEFEGESELELSDLSPERQAELNAERNARNRPDDHANLAVCRQADLGNQGTETCVRHGVLQRVRSQFRWHRPDCQGREQGASQ